MLGVTEGTNDNFFSSPSWGVKNPWRHTVSETDELEWEEFTIFIMLTLKLFLSFQGLSSSVYWLQWVTPDSDPKLRLRPPWRRKERCTERYRTTEMKKGNRRKWVGRRLRRGRCDQQKQTKNLDGPIKARSKGTTGRKTSQKKEVNTVD